MGSGTIAPLSREYIGFIMVTSKVDNAIMKVR